MIYLVDRDLCEVCIVGGTVRFSITSRQTSKHTDRKRSWPKEAARVISHCSKRLGKKAEPSHHEISHWKQSWGRGSIGHGHLRVPHGAFLQQQMLLTFFFVR